MSLRTLPAAPKLSRHDKISCDISPSARERWIPSVRASSDNNVISILDVIGADWMGEGVTVKRISAALRSIGEKDIVVEINSPGGDFFDGLAIYNMLREHNGEVTVKVLGIAASAAAIIAAAGDKIMVPRAGFLMIHNTWVIAMGNRHDLREMADFIEPFDQSVADIFAARTGLPEKEIVKLLDKESWIGGEQAVEKGFADSLLPSDQAAATAKNESVPSRVAAMRRVEAALAKGEAVPRSERRKLIKEISGTPSAAAEDGMPGAAVAVEADGLARLRLSLSRLKLETA